jgi:hypothetical protein
METQSIHSSAEVHKAVLHSMGVRAADSNSRCKSMDADGESLAFTAVFATTVVERGGFG